MKHSKMKTVVRVFNANDELVGIKLIDKPLTEVMKEIGVKVDAWDTVEMINKNAK